jgi:hypothetical protein
LIWSSLSWLATIYKVREYCIEIYKYENKNKLLRKNEWKLMSPLWGSADMHYPREKARYRHEDELFTRTATKSI